jgi:hypothetical protein
VPDSRRVHLLEEPAFVAEGYARNHWLSQGRGFCSCDGV